MKPLMPCPDFVLYKNLHLTCVRYTCCLGQHERPVAGAVHVSGLAHACQPAGHEAQVDQHKEDVEEDEGRVVADVGAGELKRKLMNCSQVKSWVNRLIRLLIGRSLLCSQSEASLLVDPTLDNDYKP